MQLDVVDNDAAGSVAGECVLRESTAQVDHIVARFGAFSSPAERSRPTRGGDACIIRHTDGFCTTPSTGSLHLGGDHFAHQNQELRDQERGDGKDAEHDAEEDDKRRTELLHIEEAVHPNENTAAS